MLHFDRFDLDLAEGRLLDAGDELELPRLSRRLLCYLAANRDRVVPVEEVRREVWSGVSVGEAAVHQALRQLRRALGDDGRSQRLIRTVRGVGYRFVAPVESGGGTAAEAPLHVYVGRDALRAELERHLERALAGRGRALLLSGEAGVGKTRTAEEVLRAAEARGALTLRAGGGAQRGAPPFWPWPALFDALARHRPLGELRGELSSLMERAPAGTEAEEIGLEDVSRFRFFDAVARCLEHASALGPLVIALDDLHEVGASAIELLAYVGRGVGRAPLLILGGYRPEEALQSVERASGLARVLELPDVSAVPLAPLSPEETGELVLSHDPPLRAPDFLALLAHRSEGNPFYAIELTRHLRSSLQGADAESVDWESRIPDGVQQILAARLAGLSGEARRVLDVYACVGGEFDAAFLAEVEEESAVVRALREAREAGLVVGDPQAPRFAHPLVREAILAAQQHDPDAARKLHLRIAETALRRRPHRIREAAFHLAEAVPLCAVERALPALRRAGVQAERAYDGEGAWECYARALALLDRFPSDDEALRCEILVAAGEVAVRGTRRDEARGLLAEATALARRLGLGALFCRAALAVAYRDEIIGVTEGDVVEQLLEALRLGEGPPPAVRARLLAALAVKVRYRPGALPRALALVDEAVALARGAGDARALAYVLEDASFVHWSVGDPERWLALNHEIVEAASEAREAGLRFRGVKGLATGHMELGDRDAMEQEMRRGAALADEAPAPYLQGVVTLQRGALALLDGRFEEGEECALQAMRCGLPAIVPMASTQLYHHRLETGRIEELEGSLQSLVESAPGIGAWRYALARLLAALGRNAEAEEQLARARPVAEMPRDRFWLAAGVLCAEAAVEIGDLRRCQEMLGVLGPHARMNVALGHGGLFYGNTAHFLGVLATRLGRLDEAERWLDAGRVAHERMRSPTWGLRSELARIELHVARGLREAALELAREVRAEATKRGMVRIAERAAAATR